MNASAQMPVIATLVPMEQRLEFLPTQYGRLFMHVEAAVYDWMRQLCRDYGGGYWEFLALSNSGGYLRPASGPWVLEVDNGYRGTLTNDAAGIVVTLFVLSHLSFRFPDSDLADRYHLLLEYAKQHQEAERIIAAID